MGFGIICWWFLQWTMGNADGIHLWLTVFGWRQKGKRLSPLLYPSLSSHSKAREHKFKWMQITFNSKLKIFRDGYHRCQRFHMKFRRLSVRIPINVTSLHATHMAIEGFRYLQLCTKYLSQKSCSPEGGETSHFMPSGTDLKLQKGFRYHFVNENNARVQNGISAGLNHSSFVLSFFLSPQNAETLKKMFPDDSQSKEWKANRLSSSQFAEARSQKSLSPFRHSNQSDKPGALWSKPSFAKKPHRRIGPWPSKRWTMVR